MMMGIISMFINYRSFINTVLADDEILICNENDACFGIVPDHLNCNHERIPHGLSTRSEDSAIKAASFFNH
jgi:hypothetical protein